MPAFKMWPGGRNPRYRAKQSTGPSLNARAQAAANRRAGAGRGSQGGMGGG